MKKIKLLFFSVLWSVVSVCTGQSLSSKVNGISFVAGRSVVNKSKIQPVVNVNANWVTLMPLAYMRALNSTDVAFNRDRQWWGERKVGVRTTANLFHNEGIKVMIKPQIWIWGGKFTGYIDMETEEDWSALEKSYERMILEFATLAQELKVELFCIGTELNNFVQKRPGFWSELITKIRKVYKGKLTYAENWDKIDKVSFWNQLDYIGIDAYFPLSESQTPSVEELHTGWQPHKTKIKTLYDKEKIPVLFTEYGYRSVDFNAKRPWNSDRSITTVNLQAQENALQAIYNEFWSEDWFVGGFLWKWFDFHNRAGGKQNSRFTPQNKPAEQLVREFYRGISDD